MSSKQSSASASSSRNPSPAPNTQQIDPYRTISSHLKRPLAPLLPQTEPLLPNLLSLNASIYSSRLSGKTLLTTPDKPSTTSSVLVQGRKRNRGNAFEKKKAREEHERNVKTREELGLEGMRKVRRRLGGVVGKGNRISQVYMLLKELFTDLLQIQRSHSIKPSSYQLHLPTSCPSSPTVPCTKHPPVAQS